MDPSSSPVGSIKPMSIRKSSSLVSQKDLWSATREGSLSELDAALQVLKRNGGNIDARNAFGLTALHIAIWRNHVPMVQRLLAAGADPDARDGESGWTSLHRALHFGHLAVAGVLIQSGASLTVEDSKCRIPIDLISGPVVQVVGTGLASVTTEVFSWGSGTNYQLGTGNAHIQKLPGKVDALHGSYIKIVAAAKFHSIAVGASGELYTWGFGRGGRLGHPDFDIHSGQAAVLTPRKVTLGLGSRFVRAIAAAKHHTVIATEGGEVFTWGSNREGQLGYPSVDSQSTPRRVSSLRTKIVAVAAANKHTAAVSECGEIFTWGCNEEGQLGYGTSNSASNYTPHVVEYLKGKMFIGVSAAKYHTVVLGADGEVFTWGHRLVTPRRVVTARNIKKRGSAPLKFHRMERLHVVSIAAGMAHSTALTDDGALFYWVSSDPDLKCQQLYSLCGRNVVNISAGKNWTAAVTTTGDVFMWDGKKYKDEIPIVNRLHGVKRATSVSVGETHMLIVSTLYHPLYPPKLSETSQKPRVEDDAHLEELDENLIFNDTETISTSALGKDELQGRSLPSLKSLCEKAAAEFLVEPRSAMQLLEIADCLDADGLRMHCEDITIRNLDYVFAVSAQTVASTSLEILARLEKTLDTRSSEPWSYRRMPTPTATFPAVINSEEEDNGSGYLRLRKSHGKPMLQTGGDVRTDSFLQSTSSTDEAVFKQIRALRKKLQQIEMLEIKQSTGHLLDDQQVVKLQSREALESALTELGASLDMRPEVLSLVPSDAKGGNKPAVSKKQRRKNKKRVEQVEAHPGSPKVLVDPILISGFQDVKISFHSSEKADVDVKATAKNQVLEENSFPKLKLANKTKISQPTLSKSKKNKKGGLSMFLSGALDDAPKDIGPPLTPKSEGPAWGGAKILKGATSLRDIQNEQSKTTECQPRMPKDQNEDTVPGGNGGRIPLSSFISGPKSSPIAVVPDWVPPASDGEKSTPPWSALGSSPVLCRPSLRDIQMQQEKKHQQSLSHSPKAKVAGFSISLGQGSPSESNGPNRWFKPEVDVPSSLRSIQIEEKAMKDLKRFYNSVKLVKKPPQVL